MIYTSFLGISVNNIQPLNYMGIHLKNATQRQKKEVNKMALPSSMRLMMNKS